MNNPQDINLKVNIDGKEANVSLSGVQKVANEFFNSFRFGQTLVGEFSKQMSASFTNAGLAIGGIKQSFQAVESMFASGIEKIHSYELTLATVSGVITSNGAAAGYTVSEIEKLAVTYSKLTLATKTQIIEAEQMLLTFKNIGHDEIPKATRASLALAQVMKSDVAEGARNLGIILEDPLQGMRKLRQMGVVLSAEQKEQMKTIIATGTAEQGRAFVLDLLAQKYGAVNDAIQKTDAFKLNQMEKSVGALQKSAATMQAGLVSPFIDAISEAAVAAKNLSPTLGGVVITIGQLTAAYGILRTTGIIPAMSSMKLFGLSLASATGIVAFTGVTAAVAALTYGLGELAKAYNHAKEVKERFESTRQGTINSNHQEIDAQSREQLNWTINYSRTQLSALQSQLQGISQNDNGYYYNTSKSGARVFLTQEQNEKRKLEVQNLTNQIAYLTDALSYAQNRLNALDKKSPKGTAGETREQLEAENERLKAQNDMLDVSAKNYSSKKSALQKKLTANLAKINELNLSEKVEAQGGDSIASIERALKASHDNWTKELDELDKTATNIINGETNSNSAKTADGKSKILLFISEQREKIKTEIQKFAQELRQLQTELMPDGPDKEISKLQNEIIQQEEWADQNIKDDEKRRQYKEMLAELYAKKELAIEEAEHAASLEAEKKYWDELSQTAERGRENYNQLDRQLTEAQLQNESERRVNQLDNEWADRRAQLQKLLNDDVITREQYFKDIDRINQIHDDAVLTQQVELWKQNHEATMVGITAIEAGFEGMFNQLFNVTRQAKDFWDGVWLSIEQSAINSIRNIINQWLQAQSDLMIKNTLKSLAGDVVSGGGSIISDVFSLFGLSSSGQTRPGGRTTPSVSASTADFINAAREHTEAVTNWAKTIQFEIGHDKIYGANKAYSDELNRRSL
jgi:hypothetical protein